jgi:hypothetical protein
MKRICHTKDSLNLTNFATRNGGWHSYKPTKATIKALVRAKELGSVETNEFGQFRAVFSGVKARQFYSVREMTRNY